MTRPLRPWYQGGDFAMDTSPSKANSSYAGIAKAYRSASLASLGLEIGLAVVVGWAIGDWLDDRLGTAPYLMLLFLVFGILAGFKGVLRASKLAKTSFTSADTRSAPPSPPTGGNP